jgi:hypothetical protein
MCYVTWVYGATVLLNPLACSPQDPDAFDSSQSVAAHAASNRTVIKAFFQQTLLLLSHLCFDNSKLCNAI